MNNLISPTTLPAVLFAEREALPKISAVYFALSMTGEVLYVGATNDLRQRWRTHHRIPRLETLGCTSIAWYACPEEATAELECAMIQHFQPPLNGTWSPTVPRPRKKLPEYMRRIVIIQRDLYEQIRAIAQREHRSLSGQIVHWL
jgi:excinuclease UvrABC nuclease subunit